MIWHQHTTHIQTIKKFENKMKENEAKIRLKVENNTNFTISTSCNVSWWFWNYGFSPTYIQSLPHTIWQLILFLKNRLVLLRLYIFVNELKWDKFCFRFVLFSFINAEYRDFDMNTKHFIKHFSNDAKKHARADSISN